MNVGAKRNKTSPLWSFFTEVRDSDHVAQCDICSQKLSYKSSITNLKTHLRRKHPTVIILKSGENFYSEIVNVDNPQVSAPISRKSTASGPPSHLPDNSENQSNPQQPPVSSFLSHNQDLHIPSTSVPTSSVNSSSGLNTTATNTSSSSHQSHISSFLTKKISHSVQKRLNHHLMKLFVLDFQPFSIVEDRGFREFVKALNSSYELPNRKLLSSSYLPAAYEQCFNAVSQQLLSTESVCLTTDCWTSKNNDSYIAVTAHYLDENFKFITLLDCTPVDGPHTSSNLTTHVRNITDKFNLYEKVQLVVTDNASNIKNAVKNDLGWKHFGCYAHTLNLVVQEALDKVQPLQEKVKSIVAFFKRSAIATRKLLDYQKAHSDVIPKKLIQSVPTRWNSTFYMLSRFVELKDAIKVTTALTSNTLPVLSEEEWEICKDLCTVLKPFEEITKQLSGEKYITGSDAIPLTRVLSSVCKSMLRQKICAPVKSVLEMLNQEIATRYHNIEHSGTLALCTFLDPRYRKPGFVDTTAAEAAKKHALELATKVFRQEKQPETQPSAPQEATSNCDSSVWEEFDRMIANTQP
ncbi:zinc finger BED domain-containing protein 4-like [Anabrus simplex]|uniref:zinc finger BED domain-containing protein 4-like n=1 Tax=Anabrus simplex TaxID=316456 RepID=UPI0035A2D3C1